jgi:DNA-binding transcriptional regulator GbsR (MarR family)
LAVEDDDDEETQRSSELVADAVGTLVEFWGFKRIMGRIWATLYLAPEPLAAKDLAARLKVSISLVSTTLSELLGWGVVRRPPRPGGRADVWEAETQVWKMLSKVLKERDRYRLERAVESLGAAKSELGTPAKARSEGARRKIVRARIDRLERLAVLTRGLLDVLLAEGTLDVGSFREISLADEDGE